MPKRLKMVLDELCHEAGVQLLLHTYVADVAWQGKRSQAVIVESKSGRQAVLGKVVRRRDRRCRRGLSRWAPDDATAAP